VPTTDSSELIEEDQLTVVTLRGELDIHAFHSLKDMLLSAIGRKKSIRIDMSDLKELDMIAIQLLYAANVACANEQISFTLDPVSDEVYNVLSLSGVSIGEQSAHPK
jgi:anti-anti-sigma factor